MPVTWLAADFRYCDGEEPVAAAEIGRLRSGLQAELGEHSARLWPENIPPVGVGHCRAWERTRRHVGPPVPEQAGTLPTCITVIPGDAAQAPIGIH